MRNDKQSGKLGIKQGRNLIGNVRLIIIILFIVFCIIVIIYNIYFETDPTEKTQDADKSIHFFRSTSTNIFYDQIEYIKSSISTNGLNISLENTSVYLHQPTITKGLEDKYYIAFEVKITNHSTIWLADSTDGKTWSIPWLVQKNLTGAANPYLHFITPNQFRLFYEIENERFISVSNNGTIWSEPSPWERPIEDKAVYYGESQIIISNHTGLWASDFKDDNVNWQKLMQDHFINSSLLHINDYEFKVIYENTTNDHQSLILTTIYFKEPPVEDSEIKWDLLIVFIVIGLLILAIMVQEVAHK